MHASCVACKGNGMTRQWLLSEWVFMIGSAARRAFFVPPVVTVAHADTPAAADTQPASTMNTTPVELPAAPYGGVAWRRQANASTVCWYPSSVLRPKS
ncbi:MAG: hypothetical protein JWM42_990 [Burkholderia sp.]|nr:hypothetical protein [Burkholderia sp.]